MAKDSKKIPSTKLAEKYGEPLLSIVDALIEGERSGKSKKKIKDIVASGKKQLKNN